MREIYKCRVLAPSDFFSSFLLTLTLKVLAFIPLCVMGIFGGISYAIMLPLSFCFDDEDIVQNIYDLNNRCLTWLRSNGNLAIVWKAEEKLWQKKIEEILKCSPSNPSKFRELDNQAKIDNGENYLHFAVRTKKYHFAKVCKINASVYTDLTVKFYSLTLNSVFVKTLQTEKLCRPR